MDSIERKRYSRQILLPEFGAAGQEKLRGASVLVIGAGGLGCPVLQYLAAAGIGRIGIIDHDVVEISNLHRQILYTAQDIGQNKAETAGRKLAAINPYISIDIFTEMFSANNAEKLVTDFDLVIDGSDNFPTRYLADDACRAAGIPLVYGSIFRFEGQVSVFNFKEGPSYRSLFPDENGEEDNCSEAGVLGILPGMVGMYMANEAIKVLTGLGNVLSGALLVINSLTNAHQIFQFAGPVPANERQMLPAPSPDTQAEIPIMSLETYEELISTDADRYYLVDVRENYEFEADNFGGINIPLSEIADDLTLLPSEKTVILYCSTGIRSKKALEHLRKASYTGDLLIAGKW